MKKTGLLKILVYFFCLSSVLPVTYTYADDLNSIEPQVAYSDSSTENGAFGYDVCVYDKTAAVLAMEVASNSGLASGGQISMFEYKNNTWRQTETLRPLEGDPNGGSIEKIDIHEKTLVAGAPFHNADGLNRSGAALIFNLKNGEWEQTAKLKAYDGSENSRFGQAVAICDGFIIVGSPWAPVDGGSAAGAVYIFSDDDSGSWLQHSKLVSDDLAAGDVFGYAVDIQGNTAVVGAYQKGSFKGAAYVFTYDGSQWIQSARLKDDHADAKYQGVSVAISDDEKTIALGSIFDGRRSGQTGAVIVYGLESATWVQKARLMAGDPEADDWLGLSVSVSGNNILAGAYQASESIENSGAAYLFEYDEAISDWHLSFVFQSKNPVGNEWFGRPVAYRENHILIGATKNSDMAESAGAAYFFSQPKADSSDDDTCFISISGSCQ